MHTSQTGAAAFEAAVKKYCSFLVDEMTFRYAGVKVVDEDPRDSYVAARYRKNELRLDIAWSMYNQSLGVMIRLDNRELKRRERYLYLEPFIEFVTNGRERPIVPQSYPGMSIGRIGKAVRCRNKLFAHGIERTIQAVAERLHHYLPQIIQSAPSTIREYHLWYESQGAAGTMSPPGASDTVE